MLKLIYIIRIDLFTEHLSEEEDHEVGAVLLIHIEELSDLDARVL